MMSDGGKGPKNRDGVLAMHHVERNVYPYQVQLHVHVHHLVPYCYG